MKITSINWLLSTLFTEHRELWNKYYMLMSANGVCMVLKHRTVNVHVVFIIRTSEKHFIINNYYNHEIKRFTFRNVSQVIKKLYELNTETVLNK